MIKKWWNAFVALFETNGVYSSELVAKLYSPEDYGYMWTARRKLTPEELHEWEELNEWAEKNNSPKTWSVKMEKVEEQ